MVENEQAWLSGDVDRIMTDDELLDRMYDLFPHRAWGRNVKEGGVRIVAKFRGMFNRRRKEVTYYRYVRDENGRVARATARGLTFGEWRQAKIKTRKTRKR